MTLERLLPCLLACCGACDAPIDAVDGRGGPPERTAWQVQLAAPARQSFTALRVINGPVARIRVTGAPGAYDVLVTLSGTSCAGNEGNEPIVEARIGGRARTSLRIAPGPPSQYVLHKLELTSAGEHLDLVFTNDFATPACDRNVELHGVEVRSSRTSP